MKMRNALLGLGLSAIAACSNPLSFGPGRVELKLDQAEVRAVPHEVLFPGSARRAGVPPRRDALVLFVSSEIELLSYFEERHRDLQVRCRVEGNQGHPHRAAGDEAGGVRGEEQRGSGDRPGRRCA
ncbi:hypothetical protein [Luteimonas saliphila]|uniref:hypothetical protein n=1 Tax=Luteimonas saliphila TaxID=2804919 RepID=UPI00192D72DD|nr:hypothetical protein [Luteimonas saliphila]